MRKDYTMTVDLSELEQYFPEINKPFIHNEYTFAIKFSQNKEKNIYSINLRINQKDTKENHLIKFRFGIGKDKPTNSKVHDTDKPHFEISLYKREKSSFSADIYFTFDTSDDEEIMGYIKGTIVIIKDILDNFLFNYGLKKELLQELIYADVVTEELAEYKPIVIAALVHCYNNHELIVRTPKGTQVIKSKHNFDKYLNKKDLKPLYLSLKDKIF